MLGFSRRSVLTGGVGLAACGSTGEPPRQISMPARGMAPNTLAELADSIVASALAEDDLPGAAFAAFDARGGMATRTWGVADREAGLAVTPDTKWPIASITKTLTAVAAMKLVDKGDIDLDEDIRTYLRETRIPDFAGPPVTLRSLLSHTAGFDEVRGRMCARNAPPERLQDFLNRKLVRVRRVGEITAYSSYAIAVAQQLIEDITQGRYEGYVADEIFAALDMRSAGYVLHNTDLSTIATPYAVNDSAAVRIEHELYITTGASSAYATTGDMARFGAALLNERPSVLSAHSKAAMLRQQASVHPNLPGWGLGFQLDQVGEKAVVEHGGDIGGFSALFTLVPEAGVGFFTVHHGEGGNLRFRIRSALLERIAPETPHAPAPRPDAPLEDYVGRYRSTLEAFTDPIDPDTLFEVTRTGAGAGVLELWGQTWTPVGNDLFLRADGLRRLGFARRADGRVRAVSGGAWRVAIRVDA